MEIRVTSSIGDLADDLASMAVTGAAEMPKIVNKNIRLGAGLSRGFAQVSAGKHGKHYPRSIGSELLTPTSGVWGPDASMPQGGMSFERGSRNQKPHLDLARAADIVAPAFAKDVGDMVDDLFWPGG